MSDKKDIQPKIGIRIPRAEEFCIGALSDGESKRCAIGWLMDQSGFTPSEDPKWSWNNIPKWADTAIWVAINTYYERYGGYPDSHNDQPNADRPAVFRRLVECNPDAFIILPDVLGSEPTSNA